MKKLKLFICCAVLLYMVCDVCGAIDVSAKSAVLYEPETGKILYQKNMDVQREIASTTKIMTAVVALDILDLNEVVTVPKVCTGIEGTSMYLVPNEKLTVSDLMYGMMLRSGNDAAATLAHLGGNGDTEKFIALMNDKARALGMKNTHFENPNGLPTEGHYSTARDMAVLAAHAMKNPEFLEIVSAKTKNAAGRALINHNRMLKIYEGADGVKTGFTKAAGRCLVSSAKRGNMRLVAVTLSAPNDWNDHTQLLDYGFLNFDVKKCASKDTSFADVPVVGSLQKNVRAACARDIALLLKKADISRVETVVLLPRFLYAPVERGAVIGEVLYVLEGKVIDSAALTSADSVDFHKKPTVLEKLLRFFARK